MRSVMSGPIPHPVSETSTSKKPGSSSNTRAWTFTAPPVGVNLMALSTKMIRICRIAYGVSVD